MFFCSEWSLPTTTQIGHNGKNGGNQANRGVPNNGTTANLPAAFETIEQFVKSNLVNSTREADLKGLLVDVERTTLFN